MSNLEKKTKDLPCAPGVYLMKNAKGKVIYIGKATSLYDRVASYWDRLSDIKVKQLVEEIRDIDYRVTPTVIEALVLEANLVKKYQPKYNVKLRDDKSFLYLGITKEDFPRLVFLRGGEIRSSHSLLIPPSGKGKKLIFGPYTSASSLRAALDILRKIFPYRSCEILPKRPCLFYQIKRCPAPCVGKISKQDYNYIIRQIILFFQGKKTKIIKNLELRMKDLAEKEKFEEANEVKKQIFALEHIQDVAVISRDDAEERRWKFPNNAKDWINIFGRIEGYDISNIGGKEAVGSMVVFENGKPKKNDYRKFKIKTIKGSNDVGMLKEVLGRRFRRIKNQESRIKNSKVHTSKFISRNSESWPKPDLIIIDGGKGQANAAEEILKKYKLNIPTIGIAKGITHKKDEFIFNKFSSWSPELIRITANYSNLLKQVRNEAHRFAVSYHRLRRKRKLLGN